MAGKHTHTGLDAMEEKTDRELVLLMHRDSREAFGELYARYKGRLTYFCKRFLKDEPTTEDIIQDIFIQLWENREILDAERSFSGYVHTLAQNRILNLFRQWDVHSRFARNILTNCVEQTNLTEDEIIDHDYATLLNNAIETLSPRQKEVFLLSRTQGLTYKEIAEQMHLSVATVQEYASIALHKIKGHLAQHAGLHFKTVIAIVTFFS